eukprot:COSAG01_NODE_11295_length_1964_cov_19.114745_1_plen_517_part_00
MLLLHRLLFGGLLPAGLAAGTTAATLPPHGLRVDHLQAEGEAGRRLTLGVGLSPTLSWRLSEADGGRRGLTQAAFEVQLVEAGAPDGPLVWGSGKVASAEPEIQVPPTLLRHGSEYDWRVRVWLAQAKTHSNSIYALADEAGGDDGAVPSGWAAFHHMETAAVGGSSASAAGGGRGGSSGSDAAAAVAAAASWIGGGNMFRTDLAVPAGKKIRSARAYVSALGAFDFYINGLKVGDHVMDPGQTVVTERVLFSTFDITGLIKPGSNAIGTTVGTAKYGYLDIWCNSTAHGEQFGNSGGACMTMMAHVVCNMTDGTSVTVSSDASWQVRHGPITYNHLWHGEIYDARREVPGWVSEPLDTLVAKRTLGGEAPGWTSATTMTPMVGELSPMQMPPIRIDRSVKPVNISKMTEAVYTRGCPNGFDGNRFIRCSTCNTSTVPVVGNLFAAVFFQDCHDHLYHWVGASGSGGGPDCGRSPGSHEVLVGPDTLAGWHARYKGVFACDNIPLDQNKSQHLFVV